MGEHENEQSPDQAGQISQQVSTIIGSPTSLTRKRSSEEDKQKEKFEKIIRTLEAINARTILLNIDMGINLNKYDEQFYDVIDNLISMQFNKEAAELIFFYVYDRLNPDGSINELVDEHGNTVVLQTAADLWMVIQSITKFSNSTKKTKN